MKLGVFLSAFLAARLATGGDRPFPDPALDEPRAPRKTLKKAVLAGGCFWCTEAVFEQLEGVTQVLSGYCGGTPETADYRLVSTGQTGHAESIEITYDASQITYGQLLRVFFEVAHDPTQWNRQGPDHGPQYRSAIFYMDDEQKRIAEAYIRQLEEARVFPAKIVTRLEPFRGFYLAEEYHQDFVRRNPNHGYVVINALPKIEKLRKACPRLVRRK
ncbi:MAG: peptide-methionine (S)-S-oxide reductase MsrA [Bryobacterales bacterium]|nr:peptide-methionine (S)-S-oxide reductase MsrA [Bryobacteraceae bacterium]MDW8354636.1 peptide-methionine (S)-S-oxide reductase MsrA [Bryobacterales bacterium]